MSDTNHATVLARRIYDEVWNRGDMAAAAEIFAQPEGVQNYVAEFRGAFPDVRHEVREMIAEGGAVAVYWSAHATHTGTFLGLPASGRTVDWTGITMLHVAGGKIVDHDTRWDMLGFAVQLGAIPAGTWLPIRN